MAIRRCIDTRFELTIAEQREGIGHAARFGLALAAGEPSMEPLS
jgi:hypothetical protein